MTVNADFGENSPIVATGGVIHGDVSFYYAAPDATPQTKYEVARHRLDTGMAREAETLLSEVLRTPFGSRARVLYHYLVAALSGRALGDLLPAHEEALGAARHLVPGDVGPEDTDDAVLLANLVRLVDLARAAADGDQLAAGDDATMEQVFGTLPAHHQRHLLDLLAGPAKNRAFRAYSERVRRRRDGDLARRAAHAWKFFHADPAEPRDLRRPAPALSGAARPLLAGGILLLVGGLLVVATQIVSRGNGDALRVGLPLALIGLAAGLGAGWRRGHHHRLLAEHQARMQGRPIDVTADDEQVWRALVLIDAAFQAVAADDGTAGRDWYARTAGLRITLAREFAAEYGADDIAYGRLNWLARWHALQIRESWSRGDLDSPEQTHRPRVWLHRTGRAGVILLVFALLVLLGGLQPDGAAAALPLAAVAAGALLLWRPLTARLALLSAHQVRSAGQVVRLAGERARWQWWSGQLAGRPTDQEMAGWLADDVAVYQADVMAERGINPSTVFCTVALTPGSPGADRARVAFGPIRYSRYDLYLIMLTRTGLRIFQSGLDIKTGRLYDETRRALPYGALREVHVEQNSVRQPLRTSFDDAPAGDQAHLVRQMPRPASEVSITRRRFVVHLDSGGSIEIELGDLDSLRAGPEPQDLVARLALEAAGIEFAQHVLETVVVDGADWIAREEKRRRQAPSLDQGHRWTLPAADSQPRLAPPSEDTEPRPTPPEDDAVPPQSGDPEPPVSA